MRYTHFSGTGKVLHSSYLHDKHCLLEEIVPGKGGCVIVIVMVHRVSSLLPMSGEGDTLFTILVLGYSWWCLSGGAQRLYWGPRSLQLELELRIWLLHVVHVGSELSVIAPCLLCLKSPSAQSVSRSTSQYLLSQVSQEITSHPHWFLTLADITTIQLISKKDIRVCPNLMVHRKRTFEVSQAVSV